MHNEIEAQFLEINKDEMRQKLRAVGAKLTKPEILMKRTVFYTGEHSFARVRDEGDKIVMTYKNITDDHSILGTKEVNLTVDGYDNAVLLLKGCGLEVRRCRRPGARSGGAARLSFVLILGRGCRLFWKLRDRTRPRCGGWRSNSG